MKNIIKLVEESIKSVEWDIDYHQNKLDKAKNNLELLQKQLSELNDIAKKKDEKVQ